MCIRDSPQAVVRGSHRDDVCKTTTVRGWRIRGRVRLFSLGVDGEYQVLVHCALHQAGDLLTAAHTPPSSLACNEPQQEDSACRGRERQG
eukprot:2180597-Rhodomonas_salina.2